MFVRSEEICQIQAQHHPDNNFRFPREPCWSAVNISSPGDIWNIFYNWVSEARMVEYVSSSLINI